MMCLNNIFMHFLSLSLFLLMTDAVFCSWPPDVFAKTFNSNCFHAVRIAYVWVRISAEIFEPQMCLCFSFHLNWMRFYCIYMLFCCSCCAAWCFSFQFFFLKSLWDLVVSAVIFLEVSSILNMQFKIKF